MYEPKLVRVEYLLKGEVIYEFEATVDDEGYYKGTDAKEGDFTSFADICRMANNDEEPDSRADQVQLTFNI